MLRGGPAAEALLQEYGVDFVVIGPSEVRDYGAQAGYFAERHVLLLEGAGTRVFGIGRPARSEPDE